MECIFCKIANKEIPAEIIIDNNDAVAFLDANPVSPGHTVIIPRFHCESLLDIGEDKMTPLWITVKEVMNTIMNTLKPEGFTVGVNHGKAAGQAVDHLHVHVIPRWKSDGGSSIHSVVSNKPSQSLTETADKIRS